MRDERGSAPVELVWLTILLLVPFVYVMIAVFDAQRAAYAVSSASKAAARAYVQAEADAARALLADLPDVPARRALEALCDSLADRVA